MELRRPTFWGYTAGEILGRHFSCFHPADAASGGLPEQLLAEALAAGCCEHEGWRIRKDGSRFWAHVAITALRDTDGRHRGFVKLTHDATRRHEVEVALREANRTMQSIFDAAPLAVQSFDLEGCITSWSRGAERLLGWTAAEAVGRFCPPVPEEGREDFLEMVRRVAAHGPEQLGRIRCKKSGERFHALLHPAPIIGPDGTVEGVMVILQDITAQHRVETALRQSEARLNNLIENALDAIISVDEGHRIQIFNKGAEAMFGYRADEILGQPLERLWPERLIEAHRHHLHRFVAAPGAARAMAALRNPIGRRKDGSEFPVEASISKHGTDGQRSFTVFLRDITARQRAEEVLRHSEQQLRALTARLETLREEERTRISREIHDELGQMLTGIRMDLRWIEDRLDDFGDDPRVNPILDRIVATAELTDATARTVQRIAADLRPGVLDKLGLPMALQYEAARTAERTGLPCAVVLPGEVPPMGFEAATAFFRIFQEALTNVIRHAGATAVEAELRVEARGCRLEIRDNGRGLDAVELENPTSLGLRGMQERARLVGGDVAFSRRPGGGTIVAVYVPHQPTATEGV